MLTSREILFGNDLRLSASPVGLDLMSNSRSDLALAQGNDNIVQALTLRLQVRKGELAPLGWPDYGSRLHELIGELNIPRTHAKLMAFAREAIEQDPRVVRVEQIRARVLAGERNVVRLEMDITLIDHPNPLNLVYRLNLEGT